MANFEASHSIINGSLSLEMARTGVEVMLFFNSSKASCCSMPQFQGVLPVRIVSGLAMRSYSLMKH